MKYFKIFIPLLLLGTVFFLSNFSEDHQSSFIMTVVGDSPVLPDVPFDYDDITFPSHLSPEPTDPSTGYSSFVDTSQLKIEISNDIATLGRVLFYDEKLSAMESISCATCHDQALSFTENKAFSDGVNALTKRNSMHLNDLGWSNQDHFAWDMRAHELNEMIGLPLRDENEIGANFVEIAIKLSDTDYYPDLFAKAYGDSEVTEDRIAEALTQFIKSMVTFNSKFDEGANNNFENFSLQELRGKDLFTNCSTCHVQGSEVSAFIGFNVPSTTLLEIFPFVFNNGLPVDPDDRGAGEWDESFDNLFKLPTLRNIELTAPYMHDGRFQSLQEVVDHYSEGIVENDWNIFIEPPGFGFSNQEKADLIAFMKTLTDKTFLTDEKWSNPFGLTSTNNPGDIGFENIVLKPNPMSDRAIIEFKNDKSQLVSINILSSDGQLIKHDKTSESRYVLDKADFGIGMYFIQLIMDDAKSTQKLIVK